MGEHVAAIMMTHPVYNYALCFNYMPIIHGCAGTVEKQCYNYMVLCN